MTVDALAAAAGVGKQTIYRWWPSKGAVLAEALTERAATEVADPDSGSVIADLEAFLVATFRNLRVPAVATSLRAVMVEAQSDPGTAEVLAQFTTKRRIAMRRLLERGQRRGELARQADLDLLVEQAFGFIWYRLLVGHAPFTRDAATRLVRGLVTQAKAP